MGLFLLGIVGGIALSLFFSFGPAFFSQIQASIHYGFRNSVPFPFGVSCGDILIVSILLLISHNIPIDEMVHVFENRWVIYIGAGVVGGFGLYTMLLKTKHVTEANENDKLKFHNVQAPSRFNVFMRGLMLNFLNPVIWVYWCSLVTLLLYGDSEISLGQRYLFFGGVLSATLLMDILKCKLASLLQRIITFRFLKIFNKCVGVILIGFAIFMVVSTSSKVQSNDGQNPKKTLEKVMNNQLVKKK
ncbi:MAG: LysE family transporter [Bacteroidales bacterium]|nr:LysE family transporter [Bacteroidales bacterium]